MAKKGSSKIQQSEFPHKTVQLIPELYNTPYHQNRVINYFLEPFALIQRP